MVILEVEKLIYTIFLVVLTYLFIFKQSKKIISNYGITKKSFLIFAVTTIPYGKMIYIPIMMAMTIDIIFILFFIALYIKR